ncbi:hypothetical protein DVR14_10850 [Natrinema thermotolerans]|nr:hypothetical protein DVR14_10850 [Natrinema thermotolerans]
MSPRLFYRQSTYRFGRRCPSGDPLTTVTTGSRRDGLANRAETTPEFYPDLTGYSLESTS